MNARSIRLFIVVSLVCLVAGMTAIVAEPPTSPQVTTIRLGYSEEEVFPFQINHNANPPGIAIELIRHVCQDMGVNVVFVQFPNLRLLQELKEGQKIDGAFIYSYKPDRLEMGVYPMKNGMVDDERRIATMSYYLYKTKVSSLQWDGKRISGTVAGSVKPIIGSNLGYAIVADLVKLGVTVDDSARTTEQNIQKLLRGRLAGFANHDLVTDNYLASNGITTIEKLPIPLSTKPYFLMFSHQFVRKYPELAEKIWTKIGQNRDSFTSSAVSKYQDE